MLESRLKQDRSKFTNSSVLKLMLDKKMEDFSFQIQYTEITSCLSFKLQFNLNLKSSCRNKLVFLSKKIETKK